MGSLFVACYNLQGYDRVEAPTRGKHRSSVAMKKLLLNGPSRKHSFPFILRAAVKQRQPYGQLSCRCLAVGLFAALWYSSLTFGKVASTPELLAGMNIGLKITLATMLHENLQFQSLI
jgi:hypothetical protein